MCLIPLFNSPNCAAVVIARMEEVCSLAREGEHRVEWLQGGGWRPGGYVPVVKAGESADKENSLCYAVLW